MSPPLKKLVDALRQDVEGSRVRLPMPAASEALEELQRRCLIELGIPVPDDYLNLLRQVNGFMDSSLTFAGVGRQPVRHADGSIYGDLVIPDLVEHAEAMLIDYEPNLDGLLVVSYSSPLYGWSPAEGKWVSALYDDGVLQRYNSFNALLEDALSTISIYVVDQKAS